MKAVKIGLLIFTVLITILLFLLSYLLFSNSRSFQSAESAFFFLGCTSAFSIYFHVKTLQYYPLFIFGKTIEELSKKYWALHIAFGLINFLLGIGVLLPTIIASNLDVNVRSVIVAICFIIYGLVTLWELYKLNKFVQVYKERRRRQLEIEQIQGAIDEVDS